MNISDIDPNLAVQKLPDGKEVMWLNVKKEPFKLYGLYNPQNEDVFKRLPDDVGKNVNSGVAFLYLHTSGGRVRFGTDSPFIAIRCKMPCVGAMPHMTLLGSSGFDLYTDSHSTSTYRASFIPGIDIKDGYTACADLNTQGITCYTINFPLYNPVDELFIGVAPGSSITEGERYCTPLPVVYYGSSITHGGCASRPGNAYPAIISRMLDCDFINLGFSGSAQGEELIAQYIAGLDMSVFVCDYDHNAPTSEHLLATHKRMYDIIRASKPEVPYIIVTKPDTDSSPSYALKRLKIARSTYEQAVAAGDKNVRFVDGGELFGAELRDCCTVDGCHPNDLGFARMATGIGNAVAEFI